MVKDSSDYSHTKSGFTIVELLVVIVAIGTLAVITIVSYTGITQKATASVLQSDLTNAYNQLKLYQVDHSAYPTSLDASNCPLDSLGAVDNTYCIKPTSGNRFLYSANNSATPQTFSLYDVNNNTSVKYHITDNSTPTLSPQVVATGGTITNVNGYRIHTFTTVGASTFTVTSGGDVDVLVVGGGGGGGGGNGSTGAHYSGGGGGAGGLIYNTSIPVSAGTYTVTVGSSGTGYAVGDGDNGGNSVFESMTAIGGGGGGKYATNGKNGGSGGSPGRDKITPVAGSGTVGQGFSGHIFAGGGGGGAGEPGGTDAPGYQGGDGLQYSISGTPVFYAGGGGGAQISAAPNYGGDGGGGLGNNNVVTTPGPGGSGVANTGGGGGGSGNGYSAGSGGSGIVIIRYSI